jgi:tripartite-type tricarboxylate transporter receptor subunit TctC
MDVERRHLLKFAGATAVLAILYGNAAWSETTRTIKIIVPVAQRGPTDTMARLLAEQIGRTQGVTIAIENRPGGGSAIGTESVAHASPDGNTLLLTPPAFVVNPHLRKVNYDPLNGFEPICELVSLPTVIVVNNSSPYQTLPDLINAAGAKPGNLTLASVGPGTAPQIAFEKLKRAANINMTFVPYPGYAPVVSALLSDQVTSILVDYSVVKEHLRAGDLRALATASRSRIEPLPNLPTVAEFGYKDYELDIWLGLFAPASTPKVIISEFANWFTAAMQVPEIAGKLVALGFYPVGTCGEHFGVLVRKQYDDYGRVIREANIRAE